MQKRFNFFFDEITTLWWMVYINKIMTEMEEEKNCFFRQNRAILLAVDSEESNAVKLWKLRSHQDDDCYPIENIYKIKLHIVDMPRQEKPARRTEK